MVAKITAMFGDVTGLQQRHHQWNIPHLVEEMKGFSLKENLFEMLKQVKNPATPPHPPILRLTLALVLCVLSEG